MEVWHKNPGLVQFFFFKRSLDNPQEMGKMGNLLTSLSKKKVPFSTSTRTCFLDVVSINQADEHQMEEGIYSIGGR